MTNCFLSGKTDILHTRCGHLRTNVTLLCDCTRTTSGHPF